MRKTVFVVAVVVAMLFATVPAIASDSKDRGWFVYGIVEREDHTNQGVRAARTLFGFGAEKAFQHRFLRKLTLEVMTGSAFVDEVIESKYWSGGVIVSHTREYLTHRFGGRWKVSLASELSIGKGWHVIPSASWSNSFGPGLTQNEYAMRIGKRF